MFGKLWSFQFNILEKRNLIFAMGVINIFHGPHLWKYKYPKTVWWFILYSTFCISHNTLLCRGFQDLHLLSYSLRCWMWAFMFSNKFLPFDNFWWMLSPPNDGVNLSGSSLTETFHQSSRKADYLNFHLDKVSTDAVN